MKDYYCSQKFWYLRVDPEKQTLNSCCAASPEKIDMDWLARNPGQLFNTDQLKAERQQTLAGLRVDTCTATCWHSEDAGLDSRRILKGSNNRTHTDIVTSPEVLEIKLGIDCNLTCSYCSKTYSTAWLNDIKNQGTYIDNDLRFQLNIKDIAISKLGQVSIKNSTNYQSIINELLTYTNLTRLEITGGEPFLYNGLERIVERSTSTVNIVTGLGVDTKRLERLLLLLPKDRVTLSISAENLNQLYEFNRYGNTYSKFLTNIEVIQNSGIGYQFYSTLSNLTIFGLGDFISKFKDNKIHLNTCADPMYLSANVLDKNSKQLVKDTDYGQFNAVIHSMIEQQFDNSLHNQLKQFIVEFAQRRNLSFNIFPDSFKNWLTI